MNQASDWKISRPLFMIFAATTPKTASGTRATTQSRTLIISSKPSVIRSIKT